MPTLTRSIFKNLKILKFNCIYLFQLGKLMFQFKNGLLPRTFDSKFALNSQVHNYDTRSSKLFHIPKIRTNICKFSLRYQGPRFYNSLSSDIQFVLVGIRTTLTERDWLTSRVRVGSFGKIRIRIYDPRSIGSWRTKVTKLWFVGSVTMTIGAKS